MTANVQGGAEVNIRIMRSFDVQVTRAVFVMCWMLFLTVAYKHLWHVLQKQCMHAPGVNAQVHAW